MTHKSCLSGASPVVGFLLDCWIVGTHFPKKNLQDIKKTDFGRSFGPFLEKPEKSSLLASFMQKLSILKIFED